MASEGTMPPAASVLIVEDNADVRTAFADLLEIDGWRVMETGNGIQALRALEDGLRPSVILLDLELPFMSGWHLHRQLRKDPSFSTIPVVIVTAHEIASSGIDGAFAVLQKPLDGHCLLDTLHASVRGMHRCP